MKQIITAYLIPALLSVLIIDFLSSNENINNRLFPKKNGKDTSFHFNHIETFAEKKALEDQFLSDKNTIYLLGSSELTGNSEAHPYNFIPKYYGTEVKAIGHAGNQCFSIYSQLLANKDKLEGSKIVIIISPMWFFSKEAAGTSSPVYLEFNSARFIEKINQSNADDFKAYAQKRTSDMFSEFASPGPELKQMHFEHQSGRSPVHAIVYNPLIKLNEALKEKKQSLIREDKYAPSSKSSASSTSNPLNWDSLFIKSKERTLAHATNNDWGINNAYYSAHIKGNTSEIRVDKLSRNLELKDLEMLLKLLKENDAAASFIIIPMNPHYYTNLKKADPIINKIENKIKDNGFPYYNYWVTDSSNYDKALLTDVMHLSDYGWLKADQFIIQTYQKEK
jgi:D-alanine transfer protein